jgi:energy-coupling factor transport system substrate-specific component
MTSTSTSTTPRQPDVAPTTWRTVDVVVAAVIAVAFGVVFWAWGLLYAATEGAFAFFPPMKGLYAGVWLIPGVLGALVIRKPGAALLTELVASIVSALLGNQWGITVVYYGLLEGIAPELVFLATRYRRWGLPTALLAGAAAGLAAVVLDLVYYYPHWAAGWMLGYGALVVLSATVVAGAGGWLLLRALARTGVLAPFASGREQRAV